jgi:hypothetical protein
MPRTDQVEIFCSYSHEDEELRNELFGHLELLRRSGIIKTWHDGEIAAGQDWRSAIEEHLRSAQVILLLVSVDLLKSEFIQAVELPLAMKRHSAHDALVVPVLLRPLAWEWSGLANLQALPEGLRPVIQWTPRDLAWASVCEGLVRAILVWHGTGTADVHEAPTPAAQASSMRRRVLDLGLPHRVPVGLSTVLAVMVRRPQSPGLAGVMDLEATYGVTPEEVKSSHAFPVSFPRAADGSLAPAELSVVLETSDFRCASPSKTLPVPPRGDSDVCVFLLTPLREGALHVNVELQYQGKRVAGCLLASTGMAQVGYEPALQASVGVDLDFHAPRFSSTQWTKAVGGIGLGVLILSGASVFFPYLFQNQTPGPGRPTMSVPPPSIAVDTPPPPVTHPIERTPLPTRRPQERPQMPAEAPPPPAPLPQGDDFALQRETLIRLNTRAVALRRQVEELKRQIGATGANLRPDILADHARMNQELENVAIAIRAGDVEKANQSLKSAEEAISHLEASIAR